MKKCSICQAETTDDKAVFCPFCGNIYREEEQKKSANINVNRVSVNGDVDCATSNSSILGWLLLSFLCPIFGWIAYFAWRNPEPEKSRACLIGSLVCITLVTILLVVAAVVIFAVLPAMGVPIILA